MPYPVVHVLFFVFCINASAVNAIIRSAFRRELSLSDSIQILFLLSIGGLFALFPDVPVVYNLLVNNDTGHGWIGPIATHSFMFSSSSILLGTLAGLIAYRKFSKAVYIGLFAESAFLSHLLLDDVFDGGCKYLYPIYNRDLGISSMMNIRFPETDFFHYLIGSFISVLFFYFIITMAQFALNQLGVKCRYKSKNN
jgi:hypothetical protein